VAGVVDQLEYLDDEQEMVEIGVEVVVGEEGVEEAEESLFAVFRMVPLDQLVLQHFLNWMFK
jgi:hypothetical protein